HAAVGSVIADQHLSERFRIGAVPHGTAEPIAITNHTKALVNMALHGKSNFQRARGASTRGISASVQEYIAEWFIVGEVGFVLRCRSAGLAGGYVGGNKRHLVLGNGGH